MSIVGRHQDGTFYSNQVFVVTCGCGGIVPDTRRKIEAAGVEKIPFIISTDDRNVKGFLKQIGLTEKIPSLKKSKHAVIYNPNNGLYIDLMQAAPSRELYDNIYRVVYGL